MTAPRATGRAPALAVAALTLAALALRVPSLGRSLWLDEAWRANIALAPTWDAFWNQVLGSGGGGVGAPMPPLFMLALRAAGAIVGHSATGMRALAVGASVAAVPLAYVVGRRAAGTAAGLVAAACFAASPTALLHGQELKQYSTDVAVVLVLLYAASTVAARPADHGGWIGLAIAMSLAPGLSYPTALVLPGIALATFTYCHDGRDRLRWLAAHAAAALVALAWYVLVIAPQRNRPLTAAYWAGDFPPLEGIPSAAWVVERLVDFVSYASAEPAWLGALAACTGLLLGRRWLGLAALASVATLVDAAALRVYPLAGGRTSIFLLPFAYLGLASVLGARSMVLRIVLGAAALAIVVPMLTRGVAAPAAGIVYEETAPLIATLEAERRPTDRVYVYDGAVQAFRFHHPALDDTITLGGSHRNEPSAYAAELHPLLVPGQRLWVLFSHVWAPPGGLQESAVILADLGIYTRSRAVHEAPGASLHLFEVTRAPGAVKHLKLTPEDLRDPQRMKELLGR